MVGTGVIASCHKCGDYHKVTPADMLLLLDAFQRGELHKVGKAGLETVCLLEAFSAENVADIVARYPKLKMFAGGAV